MRIGIDARSLVSPRRGVGSYLFEIIKVLFELDQTNQYFLYSNKEIDIVYPNSRWQKRIGRGPLAKIGSFWLQTQGRNMIISDRIDVLWGPEQTLPLFLPKQIKRILSINDLVWILYPGTMTAFNWLIHKFLVEPSIRKADRILCISHSTADDLIGKFKLDSKKIKVVYLGVDLEKFKPLKGNLSKLQDIKKRFNILGDYLLYLGTIEPRKNLDRLLMAYKAFLRSGHSEKLVIAGPLGWRMKGFIRTLRALELEKDVILTGYLSENDKISLLQGAKIFLFPSLYEGFGLPVIEAMACGVPVITSNNSSLYEIGRGGALLVNPLDCNDIFHAIARLNGSLELRDDLINKGIKIAEGLSWDKTAANIISLFSRAGEN